MKKELGMKSEWIGMKQGRWEWKESSSIEPEINQSENRFVIDSSGKCK